MLAGDEVRTAKASRNCRAPFSSSVIAIVGNPKMQKIFKGHSIRDTSRCPPRASVVSRRVRKARPRADVAQVSTTGCSELVWQTALGGGSDQTALSGDPCALRPCYVANDKKALHARRNNVSVSCNLATTRGADPTLDLQRATFQLHTVHKRLDVDGPASGKSI